MLLSQSVHKADIFYLVYNTVPDHQDTIRDVIEATPLDGLVLGPEYTKYVKQLITTLSCKYITYTSFHPVTLPLLCTFTLYNLYSF